MQLVRLSRSEKLSVSVVRFFPETLEEQGFSESEAGTHAYKSRS